MFNECKNQPEQQQFEVTAMISKRYQWLTHKYFTSTKLFYRFNPNVDSYLDPETRINSLKQHEVNTLEEPDLKGDHPQLGEPG